jgi:hypothetical protein
MIGRVIGGGLVVLLAAGPAMAGDLRASATREAARQVSLRDAKPSSAMQERQAEGARMSRALLWTGIGLLGGGALALGTGFALGDDCGIGHWSDGYRGDCGSLSTGYKAAGGAMLGAGTVLLIIGAARREKVPTMSLRRGGFVVQQSLSF